MRERTRQWITRNVWAPNLPLLWNPCNQTSFRRQMEVRIWTAWARHIDPHYEVGDSLSDEHFGQCEHVTRVFMTEKGFPG